MNSTEKKEFAAEQVSVLLNKLSNASCKYISMGQGYLDSMQYPELAHDDHDEPLRPGTEYMVVTASNGTELYVNVNHCSPYTACAAVFDYIQYHL